MRFTGYLLATAAMLLAANVAVAGDCGCSGAAPRRRHVDVAAAVAACAPQMVKKTILVPTTVTEDRTVCETECVAETRTRNYTVCETVPVTKTMQRCYTTMVPETRARTEMYCVSVPKTRDVTETYQVQVPTTKTVKPSIRCPCRFGPTRRSSIPSWSPLARPRQGTRCVEHCVPVQETATRCVDRGHWEERQVAVCNSCGCGVRLSGASCGCGERLLQRLRRLRPGLHADRSLLRA